MSQRSQLIWLTSFLCVVFIPIVLYSVDYAMEYTSIWKRLVPITGAQSLGLVVYTACIAGRFPGVETYSVKIHRLVGETALLFVLAHVGIVVVSNPSNAELLILFDSSAPGSAATSALICFGVVVALGIFRMKLRLGTKRWRGLHVCFAWLGILLAFAHVFWINQLVNSPLWLIFFLGTALVAAAMWLSRPRGSNAGEQSVRH